MCSAPWSLHATAMTSPAVPSVRRPVLAGNDSTTSRISTSYLWNPMAAFSCAGPTSKNAYQQVLAELEPQLRAAGWHTASAMSESTTWGGGSWMAYTSALFGARIDSHPQYLELLEEYGAADRVYPGLPDYLRKQGYTTMWLSPIAAEIKDEKWSQYRDFYSIDTWLRHSDFQYEGRHYGWGPAPPDQYVLEFARAQHVDASEQPVFVMFITQNSHFPYQAPELVADWRTLNQPPGEPDAQSAGEPTHQELRANYLSSIEYELRMLANFIVSNSDDDALFVLVGDHQPPRVSRRDDTYGTPIHIIARDPAAMETLAAHGFVTGLLPPEDDTGMGHEDIYSLLLDVLRNPQARAAEMR